jgi:hypothetical protein
MGASYSLKLQQADVDTAFLYGDMDTELFMKQPTGFIEARKDHLVCKLEMPIRNQTSGSPVVPKGAKLYDKEWLQKLQHRQLHFYQRNNGKNQYNWNVC